MKILSIETSCDETGVALVEAKGGLRRPQFKILENLVASQIETHRPWGGVVPHLARREHQKNLPALFNQIFRGLTSKDSNLVAVTVGPGLEPCLWSGINFAKEAHKEHFFTRRSLGERGPKVRLVGANHLEGHLYSFLLAKETDIFSSRFPISKLFPAVQLVVSGGHTMLILMESLTKWRKLGGTRDDAVGEAFDKVARMLKLPYPGGPEIERIAHEGNSKAIEFPRPMIDAKNYDFSFSGLKTSVLYYLRDHKKTKKVNVAAAFQQAAFDVLVHKAMRAVREFDAKSVMLSGGVAANRTLNKRLSIVSKSMNVKFLAASPKYQTDNGVIIAVAAYINSLNNKKYRLRAQANLGL